MGLYNKRGTLCLVFVFSFMFHFHGIIGGGEQGISTIHEEEDTKRTARIGTDTCSKDDVVIYQGSTAPLPSGIPTYTVQILNKCTSGCAVSNIHLSCGWFSSARLINPSVFRRLRYDDCLVNNGGPLGPGQSLSFEYANTYRYQLDVFSLVCNY